MEIPTKHTAAVYTSLSPLEAGLPSCLHNNENFTSMDIRNCPLIHILINCYSKYW